MLLLTVGVAFATDSPRSTLLTQNTNSITTNSSGQISGATLNSLLANIIDSAGVQQSANTWTAQNIFNEELRAKRMNLTDSGSCVMVAGTCTAQALGSTYSVAPKCVATWTGTGSLAGKLRISSTTTTVTPSSDNAADTAQVNWACFGN